MSMYALRITVISMELVWPQIFYQDKVAKEIGFKHLLEAVRSDLVILGQKSFRCGEHMNHISETEDSSVTF